MFGFVFKKDEPIQNLKSIVFIWWTNVLFWRTIVLMCKFFIFGNHKVNTIMNNI